MQAQMGWFSRSRIVSTSKIIVTYCNIIIIVTSFAFNPRTCDKTCSILMEVMSSYGTTAVDSRLLFIPAIFPALGKSMDPSLALNADESFSDVTKKATVPFFEDWY